MKKIVSIILFFLIGGGYLLFRSDSELPEGKGDLPSALQEQDQSTDSEEQMVRRTPVEEIRSRSVFVPYWADMSDLVSSDYDRYVYFGVSLTEDGVETNDSGYQSLGSFTEAVPAGSSTLLTLRMLDRELNADILQNTDSWSRIATDIRERALENDFDGVVLNLELGLMAFGEYTQQVTPFTAYLSNEMKEHDLFFASTMYGDVFYRSRPYNLEELKPHVDEFMIMAYDFSKSFGNPGPNFPFRDSENEYRYDFKQMIDEFLEQVEAEKLSVIFGMYGYHWRVDDENRALKQAEAITLNQARQRYIGSCDQDECSYIQDENSEELVITYRDEEGYKNIIWMENEASYQVKTDYILSQGIADVVYWAWGYY